MPVHKLYRVIDIENGRDKTFPAILDPRNLHLRSHPLNDTRKSIAKHLDESSAEKHDERPFLSWCATLPGVRTFLDMKNMLCRTKPLSYLPASRQLVVAIDLHDCFG